MNRNNKSFAFAILALAVSFSAMAGNHKPDSKPPVNQPSNPGSNATGTGVGIGVGVGLGLGVANSNSAASSTASAYGSQLSYDATNVDLQNGNNKALGLSFAPGAYTQVPQAYGCIATKSTAFNVVFGAASGSQSEQKSDKVCVAVKMREIAFEQCQYATAKAWDNLIVKELFPDAPAFPVNASYKDLPLSECTY